MEINKRYFGTTQNGNDIYEYTLTNDKCSYVSVLNYGGIITEICVPDKNHKIENIVLALKHLKDYEENSCYIGCTAGRIAGRVSNASFKIDDTTFYLEANNNSANLHGGPEGFNNKIWNARELVDKDYVSLELSYLSCHGDQGFPGNLNVKVNFSFDNNDNLEISYEAKTDKKTIVTLTNHSYFNLTGEYKSTILNHHLTINAEEYTEVNEEILPICVSKVEGTPFDFRLGRKIGDMINQKHEQLLNANGFDHPFLLNQNIYPQIILEEKESGRVLEITTDQPALVLYTGNFIKDNLVLRNDKLSSKHLGLCLEIQWYPDAINQLIFPKNILKPGETYTAKTIYSFKVK